MPIIKSDDIIKQGVDPLAELKASAKEFDKIIKKVTKSNKDFASALQLVKKSGDGKEAEELTKKTDKLTKSTLKLKKVKTLQVRVNEQLLKANQKLAESRTKEAAQLALVREKTRQQTKALREQAKAQLNVKNRLGSITKQILGAAGIVSAFDLAVKGMQEFIKTSKVLNDLTKQIRTNFSLTTKEAKQLAARINGLAETFDKDYKEVLIAANAVSKEFGITGQRATALIEEGFLKGSDNSGEFLDILKEYPVQFKKAGLSAEESFAIINQQVTAGVYSDKGVDAIKEGAIQLTEWTKAVEQSLSPLGENIKLEVQRLAATGETFEAMQLISKSLKENNVSAAETQAIMSTVFRGAGEDAESFVLNLHNVETSLENISIQASESEQASLSLSQSWNRFVAGVSDSDGIFGKVFASLKNFLAGAINSLSTLIELVSGGDKAVDRIAIAIENLKKATKEQTESTNELTGANDRLTTSSTKLTASQIKQLEAEKALNAERERRAKISQENEQIQTITTNLGAAGVTDGFDPVESALEITKEVNQAIEDENTARRERELEAELEQAAAIKDIKDTFVSEATQFASDLFAQDQDDKLARIQSDIEAEKEALKEKLDSGLISETEFKQKIGELNKKERIAEGKAEKRKALFDIAINTAVGIAKALPNLILAAAVGIQGGIQAALVAARPIPGFAEGVIGFKGKGTGKSDSNIAKISNGESVITAKGTDNAPLTLDAINKGLISDSDISKGMTKSQSDGLLASLLMQGNEKKDAMILALMNLASTEDYGDYLRVTKGSGQTSIHNK